MAKIIKMYCSWCITILEHTFQSRKFETFINMHSNTNFLRRSSITPLQKQLPEVFYRKVVLKTFEKFTGNHQCWSLFLIMFQNFRPAKLLKRDSKMCSYVYYQVFSYVYYEIFKTTYFEDHLRTTASPSGSILYFVDINYMSASFDILEDSIWPQFLIYLFIYLSIS